MDSAQPRQITTLSETSVSLSEFLSDNVAQHLENKPLVSIFDRYIGDNETHVDADHVAITHAKRTQQQPNLALIEPKMPSPTVLHITPEVDPTLECQLCHVKVDYKEFRASYKISICTSVRVYTPSSSRRRTPFNIMVNTRSLCHDVNEQHTMHDELLDKQNIYVQIKNIELTQQCASNKKYDIHILVGITPQLHQCRQFVQLQICVNHNELHAPSSSFVFRVPITFFGVVEHSFVDTVDKTYGIAILADLYGLIMQFAGALSWCFGEPFISDTLDICDVDLDSVALNDTGINPCIKAVYCVPSMRPHKIIKTKLKGVNLLLYNSDVETIESHLERINSHLDFVCVKCMQHKDDDAYYNASNNTILRKYLLLDLDVSLLKNAENKLDFALWIEWEPSYTERIWRRSRLEPVCQQSFTDLIEWYELKRMREEQETRLAQQQRVESVKQQNINHRKHNQRQQKNKKRHQKNHQNHLYKRYQYHRW